MALEAPGEERDDDYFRQGLDVASSTTSLGGAGGELGAAVGNVNIARHTQSTPRRRRCAVTSVVGAAAIALWCFTAGAVTFLRWRQASPGLRPSVISGGGNGRAASLDDGLQRAVRAAPAGRVLVEFDVMAVEPNGKAHEEKEGRQEREETAEKGGRGEEEEGKNGAQQEHDDDGLGCAPLYVTGLENCTEWKGDNTVYGLLGLKREMLKGVLDVLEDPKSCGEGGDPKNPLLLVQELAVDEADAVVGASTGMYLGKATDAGGWSPELGGMNRWLARYYKEVLKGTRPVIVEVHGDDVCALENEISQTARLVVVEGGPTYPDLFTGGRDRDKKGEPFDDEDFTVPLALMTVGWDPAGDPTHNWTGSGRDGACAIRLLNSQRVMVWFTSHKQAHSHAHPKFLYLPIGFGGTETRNGLSQSVYVDDARRRLRTMEECEYAMLGRYDLIFECNTLYRDKRKKIWHEMTTTEGQPYPVNHCPLPPDQMVGAASTGIFAVSPPGTGADCFRHYEMIVEGNIALVPDEDSLRSFMQGLPVFFVGKEVPWGEMTCDRLLNIAGEVKSTMRGDDDNGLGLAYEKLTQGYWREYIRSTVLSVEGSDSESPYQRRSAKPLDSPAWGTYRHVGCFDRKVGEGDVLHAKKEKSANSCASFCTDHGGDLAGTGFFGTTTDGQCWCSNDIGGVVSEGACGHPVLCSDPDAPDTCLHGGYQRSDVFVFGPPGKPLDHVYHGCFPQHGRFLYHAQHKFEGAMVPELCGAFCNSLRYPFFGVERASWCRCGVMTRYAGTSIRQPAWAEDASPHLDLEDEPDPTTAALPFPGATIGDPRFQCDITCSGNNTRLGCGGVMAWDMYSVKTPCVLFGDCEDSSSRDHDGSGEGRR